MRNPHNQHTAIIDGTGSGQRNAVRYWGSASQYNMNKRLDDHEKRLGMVEQHRAWLLGTSAVVDGISASVVGFFRGGQ